MELLRRYVHGDSYQRRHRDAKPLDRVGCGGRIPQLTLGNGTNPGALQFRRFGDGNNTAVIGYPAPPASNTFLIQIHDGASDLHLNTAAPNSWITLNTNNTERMRVDQNGNVGIGTTNPSYPLSVRGTVGAGEIIVTNTSGWSDYVFEPDYRLAPLGEVADYVRANHHLPDISSAKEVEEKGISLGEMQSKLLAKIEELTLHMIQTEKENQELRRELDEVKARIAK